MDRGRTFVTGVIERAGEDALARLWGDELDLPTPAEVDARASGSPASACSTDPQRCVA